MIGSTKLPLAGVVSTYLAIAGCLSPTPWWEKDLRTWIGADAQEVETVWGPPERSIVGKSGHPVMVYESHTTINLQEEALRDPSKMVSDRMPDPGSRIEDLDCEMYFEVENDKIVDVWFDGAGCQVIPRPAKSPAP